MVQGTELALEQLPNGLRMVHLESQGHVCYIALMVRLGSRDEQPEDYGLSHLLEHMLFKGTRCRSAYQVSNRLESVGGDLNAYTSKEELVVQAALLPRDLQRGLELVADVVVNPTFPPRELARERDVVLEEIASYRDAPSEQILDDFEVMLFATPALGHPILGDRRRVVRFTSEDLHRLHAAFFRASNMVLATAGPLKAERVFTQARKYFSAVPTGSLPPMRPQAQFTCPRVQWHPKSTTQAHCVVGGQAISMLDPHYTPLALLLNVMAGDASNARLNRILREHRGLIYQLDGALTTYMDLGFYAIYFGTEARHLRSALRLVAQEFDALCQSPLGCLQLSQAKRQYIGQLYMGADNIEAAMLLTARRVLEALPMVSLQQAVEEVHAVTAQQLLELAQHYFEPTRMYTLIYGRPCR